MEKLNNNKVLRFFVQFITNTIFAMILWPLLDMFFRVVVDKQEFIYSVQKHILEPVMFGFFMAIFLMIGKRNTNKESKSSTK